jgi:hypothetical protein
MDLDYRSSNERPMPRNVRLNSVGRLVYGFFTVTIFLLPLLVVALSLSASSRPRTSTIIGCILMLEIPFCLIASFLLVGYSKDKKLLSIGTVLSGRISDKLPGFKVRVFEVEFTHLSRSYKASVTVGMKVFDSAKVGDDFTLIFNPNRPSEAKEFPLPLWTRR